MATTTDQGSKDAYKLKEPQTSEINISGKREPRSYKLACKFALKKFGEVELRGVGGAAGSVVILAQTLVKNKFATIEKIDSGMIDLESRDAEAGARKAARFVVKLKKTPEFDSLTKDLPSYEN